MNKPASKPYMHVTCGYRTRCAREQGQPNAAARLRAPIRPREFIRSFLIPEKTMKNLLIAALVSLAVTPAVAQSLGEHPAVIVAKQWTNRGYDYQSKFYRHPAGLALLAEAPHEMGEHPAVIVKRNWDHQGYDYVAKFYAHPARLTLLAAPPVDEQRTLIVQPARPETHSLLDVGLRFDARPVSRSLFDAA